MGMVFAAANGEGDNLNEFWGRVVVFAIASVVVFLLLLTLVAWAVISSVRKGRLLRKAAVDADSFELRG
jgi:hypothetical protein